MRYTVYLDHYIQDYFIKNKVQFNRIYPKIPQREIKQGSFLDAPTTIEFKSKQLAEVAAMYYSDEIKDGDIIFTSDIWFPGIESIAYLNYFCKKDVKLRGILHAGSFTDTDFVRDMERWAKGFEDVVFDIADRIIVGSEFIKKDVCKKRYLNPDKVVATGFPLDLDELKKYKSLKKENIVVFNGRNVDEKQPWLFETMCAYLKERSVSFNAVNTHKLNMSKEDYYTLLGKAKVVVSYALQENFGFGIREAVYLGCIPVVPNKLVYPEIFSEDYLYNNFLESIDMVEKALSRPRKAPEIETTVDMSKWFN